MREGVWEMVGFVVADIAELCDVVMSSVSATMELETTLLSVFYVLDIAAH